MLAEILDPTKLGQKRCQEINRSCFTALHSLPVDEVLYGEHYSVKLSKYASKSRHDLQEQRQELNSEYAILV